MSNAPFPHGRTGFGRFLTGDRVDRVILSNGILTAAVLTQGVTLQGLWLVTVPYSLTLGCATLAEYQVATSYLGALVGPVANRISGAQAMIHGRLHRFDANENGNTLHSGRNGVHNRLWTLADLTDTAATFTLDLPDGDGGFPGNRRLTACYSLDSSTLRLDITASTDAPTPISIANHSYWNLDGTATWAGHSLQINAARWLPVTAQGLPSGAVLPATGEMDFRQSRCPGPGAPALDHNFCLAPARRDLSLAARLTGASGLSLWLSTTEPGLQVYDGRHPIRPGDTPHAGLALEPQGWPDALHQPGFPTLLTSPQTGYHQTTEWRFGRS